MENVSINIEEKLVNLQEISQDPVKKWFIKLLEKPIERTFSIDSFNRAYIESLKFYQENNYFDACLKSLGANYTIRSTDLQKIPSSGPLLTVANHPFGGIEGLILGHILLRIRSDVKILGNFLLQKIPELKPWIIPVDPFNSKNSISSNLAGIKESIRWLKDGGALITFPSGEVSYFDLLSRKVKDPFWNSHLGSIIKKTKASVIPFYFPGQNSHKFQMLGLLNPRLRTVMLPHELINKRSKSLKVFAGNSLSCRKLSKFDNNESIINFLRLNTYNLRNKVLSETKIKRTESRSPTFEEIKSVSSNLINSEIGQLPDSQKLVQSENYQVYYASYNQIPNTIEQIGYLREKTFREVNEGTGKACDLDHFDFYYHHLFLWDSQTKEITGAYRIGKTDQIIATYGLKGLYTNTLFHYKPQLINYIQDALELGRSFIINKYQKSHSALSLLWKGIGEYVVRNPKYKKLFGPVSISQDYHHYSKSLIIQFLKSKKTNLEISKYVIARNPYKNNRFSKFETQTIENTIDEIEDISILVSDIEKDGKGVPILLRNYLKLNAKMIGYNVDQDFSDVLDCLIMVDLRTTEEKILKRFMGRDGFEKYVSN